MDGFKKRLRESVQLKLSFTLSMAILVIALLAGSFSSLSAFNEARELQDGTLRQVATLFDRQHPPFPHFGDDGSAHRLPHFLELGSHACRSPTIRY